MHSWDLTEVSPEFQGHARACKLSSSCWVKYDWCHFWWLMTLKDIWRSYSVKVVTFTSNISETKLYKTQLLKLFIRNHTRVFKWYVVRHFPGLAFSSPANWSVIFQFLHFPALRFGPSFSSSCIFQPCELVRHFPGPAFSVAPQQRETQEQEVKEQRS